MILCFLIEAFDSIKLIQSEHDREFQKKKIYDASTWITKKDQTLDSTIDDAFANLISSRNVLVFDESVKS